MARNSRRSNGMKKIEPAVQTMMFQTDSFTGGGQGSVTIDLSQCASLMNRRFYRQGLNWAVGSIKITAGSTSSSTIICRKLPNTWVMGNAWEKGFRAWQEMIKNATDESGARSIKGKFLDFKIYADSVHHDAGFDANLLPFYDVGVPAPVYTAGQWQPANYQIPNPNANPVTIDEREIIAVGPNFPGVSTATGLNAVSLIQGYADSRALPSPLDPNVPADADGSWMVKLFSDGTLQDEEVIGDLETDGNNPPYPFEGDVAGTPDTMYPGGETQAPLLEIHDIDNTTTTTVGGQSYIKGGNFPCGLIRLDFFPTQTQNYTIQVDLVPGHHRGYLCSPMTEM